MSRSDPIVILPHFFHQGFFVHLFFKVTLLGCALALSACTVLESEKINYKSAGKIPSLDIPPDLTQLSKDNRYATPGVSVSASSYSAGQATAVGNMTAVSSIGDVRIERAGNQRWLVISRSSDQLWAPVKDFWQENGFLLTLDQSNLGIMETDWAENRAKIPQDFIRATLGKLLDGLYSTGERDKFRTRLERNSSGGTEIYISHRGMAEVYTSATKDKTVWQPRPVDPELEVEFLRRLMVKLGVSQAQSTALVAAGASKTISRISTVNGQTLLHIDEGFDRAWRRVGLSLDRTGFTVEDRDRVQGTYFVRYVAPNVDKSEPGFFSKLFSSSPKTSGPLKYRIVLRSQPETTTVSVLDSNGQPESSENAQRIIKVLVDDLK